LGRPTVHFAAGGEAVVRIEAEFSRRVEQPVFAVMLSTETGLALYHDSTRLIGVDSFEAGERATCDVRFKVRLPSGTYSVRAFVGWGPEEGAHTGSSVLLFYVDGRPFVGGQMDLEASFDVRGGSDLKAGPDDSFKGPLLGREGVEQ
jgi:hypothetical protein